MNIDTILTHTDLRTLAEEAGAVFNRHNASICPLHPGADNPGAFHLFTGHDGRQRWRCFTRCPDGGNGGDAIDFYVRWRGVDFRAALEALARRAGLEHRLPPSIPPVAREAGQKQPASQRGTNCPGGGEERTRARFTTRGAEESTRAWFPTRRGDGFAAVVPPHGGDRGGARPGKPAPPTLSATPRSSSGLRPARPLATTCAGSAAWKRRRCAPGAWATTRATSGMPPAGGG
jgi:hypothetical protein